jgi:hypothetical protein
VAKLTSMAQKESPTRTNPVDFDVAIQDAYFDHVRGGPSSDLPNVAILAAQRILDKRRICGTLNRRSVYRSDCSVARFLDPVRDETASNNSFVVWQSYARMMEFAMLASDQWRNCELLDLWTACRLGRAHAEGIRSSSDVWCGFAKSATFFAL